MHGFGGRLQWCFELEQDGLALSGRFTDIYADGTVGGALTPTFATTMTVTRLGYVPFFLQVWVDQAFTQGGGVAFDYFQGGPGTYDLEKVTYDCFFWDSLASKPDVRLRAR